MHLQNLNVYRQFFVHEQIKFVNNSQIVLHITIQSITDCQQVSKQCS
ncbi:unnamed protein product [Paramecium primaurelia]|uniref:Uncharacterized protein n=1 Tax=Paramecium primaurelia TaxID=5886 RepID=A0A8S1JMU6_PARPR|nr:unnamed protein product [Paramecium primaurelia]